MPTTLSETAAFPSTIDVPASGDARTAASVNGAFGDLADRTRMLITSLSGHLLWDTRLRAGTVTAGIGVYVGAIAALAIGEKLIKTNATETEVPGSLPLALSTWFHVYGYDDTAGGVALEYSTSAPDTSLTWKGAGFGSHRYLGSFRTDGAGAPILMAAVHGYYRWLTAPAAREVLSAGNATAATSIACAAHAPTHARRLCVSMNGRETSGSSRTINLYQSTTGSAHVVQQIPASSRVSQCAEVPCSTTQTIAYLVSSVDADLTLYVDGWVQ